MLHILLIVTINLTLGVIATLSLPFIWSDASKIVLEPLGLVDPEPTANDDPIGLGLVAFLFIGVATWFASRNLASEVVGSTPARWVAALAFVLPTVSILAYIAL